MQNHWEVVLRPPAEIVARPTAVTEKDLDPEIIARRIRVMERKCPTPGCDNRRIQLRTGAWCAYCKECNKIRNKEYRARVKSRVPNEYKRRVLEGLCTTPGCSNKRHVTRNGRQLSKCRPCKRIEDTDYQARRLAREIINLGGC
jgi:hypothetical protein